MAEQKEPDVAVTPEETELLGRRVRELEEENDALRAKSRRRPRARSILAAIALTLAVLLAPLAVLSSWVRAELVNTDRFVSTLAPLADDPDVQRFLGDQVMAAVDAHVDFDGIVSSLVAGLSGLDLPAQASASLALLQGPAAQGMRSVVASTVDETIASDAFSGTWQLALVNTHRASVALLQGNTRGLVTLDKASGTLSLEAGVVLEEVKTQLSDRGVSVASMIPDVDASIPITTSTSLVGVQAGYQATVALGYWLPWIALGLLVLGVALARHRARALTRAGVGLFLGFMLVLSAISVGAAVFENSVSPTVMPVETAAALTTQLTLSLRALLAALALTAALVTLAAMILGPSRGARALRGALTAGFARVRSEYTQHGLSTGAFGTFLDRYRAGIMLLLAAGGVLVVFLSRPVSFSTVAGTTLMLLLGLALIELLRRPATAPALDSE